MVAQLKTATSVKDWESFRKGIHLDLICQELPGEKDKILRRYRQAEERLNAFPFGIQHGDLTPFNIYPDGIIDLEDSFMGPMGYDLGAFSEIHRWFPEMSEDEFHNVYKFTTGQKIEFTQRIDMAYLDAGLPKPSDYKEDFNFTKGVWFTVRMQSLPILQQFRYEIIRSMI
jgi:hypothetical protein